MAISVGWAVGLCRRRFDVRVHSHAWGTLGFYRIRYFIQKVGSSVKRTAGASVRWAVSDARPF